MVGCTYVRNWAGKQRPHVVGRRIVIDTMISPGCIIQRNNCGIDLRNINRVILTPPVALRQIVNNKSISVK